MTTNLSMERAGHLITVESLTVEVVRKAIKNLHLAVYPPLGRVRVAVPLAVSDDAVRLAVVGKLGWIKRQQARFVAQPRQSQRAMVTGESHYFLGKRYRLRIVSCSGAGKVALKRRVLELHIRPEASRAQRETVLREWYRQELKRLVAPLLAKWEAVMEVESADWGVRQMKTKWGSCNIEKRHIWLNLELAKKPVQCVEYIIVHELVHLWERQHNEEFRALLDRFLPQWRLYRDELNQLPLGHEAWQSRNVG